MHNLSRRAALAIGAAGMASPLAAQPRTELWPRWQAHDPASRQTVDHGAWQRFVARHVTAGRDGINRIAYGRIPADDRAALAAYLDALARTPVSRLARPEQFAFWANLYNALTVRVVLDHFPVASIRDIAISPGLFSVGPWGRKLIAVEGEMLSLDDVEHRILRPIWRDPRVHYAVNCASLGCPNLPNAAFTAATLEAMLEAGARAMVNHPRGVRVEAGRLTVSSIYVWFQADFGGSDAGVISHLARHAAAPLAAALAGITRIASHRYDWALNLAA